MIGPRTALLAAIVTAGLTQIVACDQTRYYYAESTNGVYNQPTDRMLDSFRVDTQASAHTADTLNVGIFITRNQQIPFVDADIALNCKDFNVFAEGKLLSAATFSCAPTTTISAQMRVDATFAIRGKRPQKLLIQVPTLRLLAGIPSKNIAFLRAYDVALELRKTSSSFSVR